MTPAQHHVVILGASPKPARYANQVQRLLSERGYQLTLVHPKLTDINGLPVTNRLDAIDTPVHTLTLYVGPQRLEPDAEAIVALKPRRVIFNPGTESVLIQQRLDQAGITWIEACTLVMLKTDVFLEDCEPLPPAQS